MSTPETCGQGLADRSPLPAKLGALCAAMASTLATHQRTLDLTDSNARVEHEAYQELANAFRNAAAQLQSTADRMLAFKDLPVARHDERALRAPEMRDVFASFVEREHDLSVLLSTWIKFDGAMLGEMSQSPQILPK
jgi:hypothetical protein